MGGEGDDRQRCAALAGFPLADLLGALATVHARHLHVHQYQVEMLVLHGLDGGIATVDGQYVGPHVFEQGLHQQQVRRVVVDTQHFG
ncbi:hypothetical protein D3C75_1196700 [compost metagenome]